MPSYRFSWEPFDDDTVVALATEVGFHGDRDGAREYLTSHVKRPGDDFVRKTKGSITKYWLPQHPAVGAAIVRELFDLQIGPMGAMPVDAEGCVRYVEKCRNSSGLRDLLTQRLVSFGDTDRDGDDNLDTGFIPRFGTIDPARQVLQLQRREDVSRSEPYSQPVANTKNVAERVLRGGLPLCHPKDSITRGLAS